MRTPCGSMAHDTYSGSFGFGPRLFVRLSAQDEKEKRVLEKKPHPTPFARLRFSQIRFRPWLVIGPQIRPLERVYG